MKKTILLIFGGTSSEHEVSCKSAASIAKNIDKEVYDLLTLGVTKEGQWFLTEATSDEISKGQWEKEDKIKAAVLSPERNGKCLIVEGKETLKIDCVFPIIHGKFGEDGTLQGLLEIAGIPYVGSGVMASAAAMDKAVTKMFADKIGIRQAKYFATDRYDIIENMGKRLKEIEDYFQGEYPLFVKPANAGSSVGISKVGDLNQLFEGIKTAAEEDHKIIVEETIIGREVEVAVLGNRKPLASPIGEIMPVHEYYDYESKYLIDTEQTRIADDLSEEVVEELQENSKKIFKALGCNGLARVDFFVREGTDEVIFNEINTLPGFTTISMYPKLWEADGLPMKELIDRLIILAFDNHDVD